MDGLIGRLREAQLGSNATVDQHTVLAKIRKSIEMDAMKLAEQASRDEAARRRLELYIRNILIREGFNGEDCEATAHRLVAEIAGLGPIDAFMRDPEVTEIMVNGPSTVYVERGGVMELAPVVFSGPDHVINTVQRLIAPLGKRLDLGQPFVDVRLPDGSRLHAVIPPIALDGPVVTIRRFPTHRLRAKDLIRRGMLTPQLCSFLVRCVRSKLNILISGGTSTGKTTLLNVLASFIPAGERILTLEEAAELRIDHPHVVALETRGINHEGKGEVTLRQLVRNALRMRPDRIIVGEVRGAEAFDLLQAWNTGHAGSLSTVHANSPYDAITRLETMVLTAPEGVPHALAERLVRSTVDVVVQLQRFGNRRQVVRVCVWDTNRSGLSPLFESTSPGQWTSHRLPEWLQQRLVTIHG